MKEDLFQSMFSQQLELFVRELGPGLLQLFRKLFRLARLQCGVHWLLFTTRHRSSAEKESASSSLSKAARIFVAYPSLSVS
eukprot:m.168463 g.168463  ORF g.168463 m.168463 type:complete len:81 (+) comp21163_c0_seq7:102-344(+)